MKILNILNELAATPSTKAKIEILKQHKEDLTLKQVCFLALDPRTHFYIKKIPDYTQVNQRPITIDWALDELDKFAKRELTGNTAIERLMYILASLHESDAEVIKRVISRDLKCGVSDSTINKVWPKLIPEFPYMRCALPKDVNLASWDWAGGVFSEVKADGMFVNINNYSDSVKLLSRPGTPFPDEPFADLIADIRNNLLWDTQTHGEILVSKGGNILPREIGNGILNSVIKGGSFEADEFPLIKVWDQIPISAVVSKGTYEVARVERKAILEAQLPASKFISFIETRIVHSMEEAHAHYTEVLARGGEGTILKKMAGIWRDGTSKEQVKMKLDVDVDLKVIGFTQGKGKNASTFGAITCVTSDWLLEVNVSGFKDKATRGCLTRQEIWDNRENILNSIITVKSNNITPPTKSNPKYSLFLPRYVEFRNDKTVADSLPEVQAQFDSAIKG